ncbi:MAG: hypothetical protein QOH86_2156 [Sphingomonadales bacterium]|nr:hypothetical protein [Sphingomonadales bacterium]
MALLSLLVFGAIAFFVIKAVSKSNGQAKAASARLREGNLEPDYIFNGRIFATLSDVARRGGDDGLKISLGIYGNEKIIRIAVHKGNVFDIPFDEIDRVSRVARIGENEFGEHSFSAILIETHSQAFPWRELVLFKGEYELLDKLTAAINKISLHNEVDSDAELAQVSVSQPALSLETSVGTQTPAPTPANPVRGADNISDEEVDAALEELRVACETDPERGLALIDGYSKRDSPGWNFLRVLAYRRILVGSEADARSGRYGTTLDEVARGLPPHKLECGMKALHAIAEIEREEPNYFCDGDVKEGILDAVCHLMERARPGIVQQTLGWTKLDYFGEGRVSCISEKVPGGGELQRVSDEIQDRVLTVRFKADAIVRSALATRASGPGPGLGRGIGFMLFERLPDRSERVIGDRIHVGSVDIGESGDWRYTPKGDGPSIRGSPIFQEKAEQN